MATKSLVLKAEDYEKIDAAIGKLEPGQFYTVITHRIRGKFLRSVHVFARQPNEKELLIFEDTSSKVRVRGRHTEFEGSQIKAYVALYDKLVLRAYDVPDGFVLLGEIATDVSGTPIPSPGLSREDAIARVNPVIKREALRDTVGEVYSEARIADLEGDDTDAKAKEED